MNYLNYGVFSLAKRNLLSEIVAVCARPRSSDHFSPNCNPRSLQSFKTVPSNLINDENENKMREGDIGSRLGRAFVRRARARHRVPRHPGAVRTSLAIQPHPTPTDNRREGLKYLSQPLNKPILSLLKSSLLLTINP